jgi:2-dehydro-3-deoxyglucarate aldolase
MSDPTGDRAAALKQAMREKQLTFGSWLSFSDTFLAEMMVRIGGFDWAVVDMEHSATSFEGQGRLIQTIDLAGAVPFVRLGANEPFMIKRALDCGAHGIIVPQVNAPEEAQAAVEAAHYPPDGARGVGLFRAQHYGLGFPEYRRASPKRTIVVAQIEHYRAVERLDEILAVEGIDGFLIGPYDLSGSLGKPGEFDAPEVVALFNTLERTLKDHPKPGGFHIVQSDAEQLGRRIDQGARFMAYGTEMVFLAEKLDAEAQTLRTMREAQTR